MSFLEIKDDVEQALSEKFGEPVELQSFRNVGGGCINHASKVTSNIGDFFLKWNSSSAPDLFLREAESLRELKKAAGEFIFIPEVFAAKTITDAPGFLVLEFLPPSQPNTRDDEKLGRGLAHIHKYRGKGFGFYNNNYCGATLQENSFKTYWPDFFRDNRLSFLLRLIQKHRRLPANEVQVYDKLLFKLPQLIPNNSDPVLIHGDLWSGNYMATQNGPALIDPASYYANREMEFSIMTMFGGFSQRFYSAYNEVNPLDADWRSRNSLYQLYHILNHYYLFGGGYRQQAITVARRYL